MSLKELREELRKKSDPAKAKVLQKFFKTGHGEYGYGDIFLGVIVPESRKIAVKFNQLSIKEIEELLKSKIHEERMVALLILVYIYNKNQQKRKEIFDFYLRHSKNINNWDLVDLSAPKIVGHFLYHFNKEDSSFKMLLADLARSSYIW